MEGRAGRLQGGCAPQLGERAVQVVGREEGRAEIRVCARISVVDARPELVLYDRLLGSTGHQQCRAEVPVARRAAQVELRGAGELADCLVGMTRGEPGDAELRVSFGLVGQERRPALHRIDGGGGVAEEELCATQLDERSAEAGSLL